MLAYLKKLLVPLGAAATAFVADVPPTGTVNWREAAIYAARAGLAALGVQVAVTSDAAKTAAASVAKR